MKQLSLLAFSIVIVLVLAGRDTVTGEDESWWFGDFRSAPAAQLTYPTVAALVHHLIRGQALVLPEDTSDTPQFVFLTASDGIASGEVVLGRGTGLDQAARDAVIRLQESTDLHDIRWLKVDIVREVYLVPAHPLEAPLLDDRSLWGLALQSPVAFLPEQLNADTVMNSENRLMWAAVAEAMTSSGTGGADSRPDVTDVYRFQSASFFSDGEAVVPLYRGHRWFAEITPERLIESALMAGDYLTRAVEPDGRFIYSYRPKTDEIIDDYNILRHAGTLYSMLELVQVQPDADLMDSARRAAEYLLRSIQPCNAPLSAAPSGCVVEEDEVKLGGNALAIVALVEYLKMQDSPQVRDALDMLGEWIVGAQYDDGRFVHKLTHSTQEISSFISAYYPGEAILALVRLYGLTGDERYLDSAERATRYLIMVRDLDKPIYDLAHDHWLLYGLNELYRLRPDPVLMEHSAKIIAAIELAQHRIQQGERRDWYGGFYNPPRSTPTSTRSEGACAAYQLFRDHGQDSAAGTAADILMAGLRFQLQTQFRPEKVMYLDQPLVAMGGFHSSLTNFEIRIDYVQHNLSSLLCAYREIYSESDNR